MIVADFSYIYSELCKNTFEPITYSHVECTSSYTLLQDLENISLQGSALHSSFRFVQWAISVSDMYLAVIHELHVILIGHTSSFVPASE